MQRNNRKTINNKKIKIEFLESRYLNVLVLYFVIYDLVVYINLIGEEVPTEEKEKIYEFNKKILEGVGIRK